ncbi:Retrovirus-related Pol polyprotein from transposon TNT 1-94 [Araneus ventricosus]|uniref:Retrovirus-related Pol polyprotein from transposon TNT 1-94 n=1 Tax=Araneus ventricosus TaxID=182803 RepID=A0A4Y2E114_ARAVE|nr:Retrovirus-related Pol polyprotein from transposon TNT 1-94 [Araneus ventricosus]
MDKKAVKSYLVGYDGDEHYRIWLKEENEVISSRDVIFQEKPSRCVQLILKEPSNEGKHAEEKLDEKVQEPTSDAEDNSEENEQEITSDTEEDNDEELQPSSDRQLRNHSLLCKPARFEDFIIEAESFIYETDNSGTFEEAINSRESANWKKAMESEMASHRENQTRELTNLPTGSKALLCRWVFRIKTNPDGSINKYKARLVVKGYSQRQGIDYNATYSPVAKLGTIRAIRVSIAAEEKMYSTQFDVSTAFLYRELDQTIYMQQPEGYKDRTERVCKLKRSLYGLKQAPHCWNKCFGQFLLKLSFKASDANPCLYDKEVNGRKLLIMLYLDDGLVSATNQEDLDNFLKELKTRFKVYIGEVSCFLGLKIECHKDGSIGISQKAYARKILQHFGFEGCKPAPTPMLKESRLQKPKDIKRQEFPYLQAIGALMYLMVGARPDIAYSVGYLSRSLELSIQDTTWML